MNASNVSTATENTKHTLESFLNALAGLASTWASAGLKLGSSLQASLASALEPVNRMKFLEADMAAYAESVPLESAPGAAWNYHDGNTVILGDVIRQASGGSASNASSAGGNGAR